MRSCRRLRLLGRFALHRRRYFARPRVEFRSVGLLFIVRSQHERLLKVSRVIEDGRQHQPGIAVDTGCVIEELPGRIFVVTTFNDPLSGWREATAAPNPPTPPAPPPPPSGGDPGLAARSPILPQRIFANRVAAPAERIYRSGITSPGCRYQFPF